MPIRIDDVSLSKPTYKSAKKTTLRIDFDDLKDLSAQQKQQQQQKKQQEQTTNSQQISSQQANTEVEDNLSSKQPQATTKKASDSTQQSSFQLDINDMIGNLDQKVPKTKVTAKPTQP